MEEHPNNETEQTKTPEEVIDIVAKQYHFEPSDWKFFSSSVEKENKIFLAMLNEYVSKVNSPIFEKDVLKILDFGAGYMPYLDGYKTFFERFQREDKEKRKADIVAWDSDDNVRMPGNLTQIFAHLKSKEQVEILFKRFKINGFDVITMFGVGPSSHITDPEHVEKSYQTVINILSSVLPTGGVIILTTSFGGPKRENLIRYLEESGLEVSVNESNKYGEMLGNKLGFTHDEIIIATKKAEQENKTHKIMDGI